MKPDDGYIVFAHISHVHRATPAALARCVIVQNNDWNRLVELGAASSRALRWVEIMTPERLCWPIHLGSPSWLICDDFSGSIQILVWLYFILFSSHKSFLWIRRIAAIQSSALFRTFNLGPKNYKCPTTAVAAQFAEFRYRTPIVHVQSSDTHETRRHPRHRRMSRKKELRWQWKCVQCISSLSVVYKQFTPS